MKVVILAGGYGTRLGEYTERIPKPMVKIGGKPILWHIMNRYSMFGHNEFLVALGYKSEVIKDYFMKYRYLNSDFSLNLSTGETDFLQKDLKDWKITLIDTGIDSMTGGRLKRLREYIGDETFLLTYGDGLSDINFDDLISLHRLKKKMVTVTAVHPKARFGELMIKNNKVISFKEKPQVNLGWINGGFFVINPEFLDYIKDDSTVLEQEPLEKIAEMGELTAHLHEGFWQCMDTKRDKDYLEKLIIDDYTPWLNI